MIAALQITSHTRFHNLTFSFSSIYTQYIKTYNLQSSQSAKENYTSIFLEHAHFYVLADKYNIKLLKTLILIKLHDTLCKFSLYEAHFENILKLVYYTYKNTLLCTSRNLLCELITHYIAYKVKIVTASEQSLKLMKKNESFTWDLLSMILKRVV